MNGLLIVDKPTGPTSHDVVARVRRLLGERRVGHTGTLDPGASGVLPLVIGRATRLARFLSGQDKCYRATIRLGVATDSYDSAGTQTAPACGGALPDRDAIDRVLLDFRGTFTQQPPAYSAKKIGGERSYRLARRASAHPAPPALPAPVQVTVQQLEILDLDNDRLTLHVECSAGFYVRSLAHDIGVRLGVGAHLVELRRLSSGDLVLADAMPLDAIEADPDAARAAIIPPARMLPSLAALQLTDEGVRRAVHGRDLRPEDCESLPAVPRPSPGSLQSTGMLVRLMDPAGNLVGLAEPSTAPGLLHPFVVLV